MTQLAPLLYESGLKHFFILDPPPLKVYMAMHFGIPSPLPLMGERKSNLLRRIFRGKREPTEIERQNAFVRQMRKSVVAELKRVKAHRWVKVGVEPLRLSANGRKEMPLKLVLESRTDDGKGLLRELVSTLVSEFKIHQSENMPEFVERSFGDVGLKKEV